jgi:RNA recognition motif-containing protein
MTLFVGNLPFRARESDIREMFEEIGPVKSISIPTDRESGRPRGFAFVELEDDKQEDAAIQEFDGVEFDGRQLRINKAQPREQRSGGGGGAGGGRREQRPRY